MIEELALSAKVLGYMTTGGTVLASLGASLGVFEGLTPQGSMSNAVIGFVLLGVGLVLKYEKQVASIINTPEAQQLIDSVPADIAAVKARLDALEGKTVTAQAASIQPATAPTQATQ